MISFDNTVTEPSALKVTTDELLGVLCGGMAGQSDGRQGDVIMVTGVAGTHGDTDRNAGAEDVWAKYPDIKVVNRYTGMWESATAEPTPRPSFRRCRRSTAYGVRAAPMASSRPSSRQARAAAADGRRGGERLPEVHDRLHGPEGKGISIGEPPFRSVVRLEVARQVLKGRVPKKDVNLPLPSSPMKR